jgi:hypothetical protein
LLCLCCCAVASSTTLCSTCICSLVEAYTPALRAAGIKVDTANPASFPIQQAAGIIASCSEQYIVTMLAAGVEVSALEGLRSCSSDNSSAPPACMAEKLKMLNEPAVAAAAKAPEAAGELTCESVGAVCMIS